MHLQVIGVSFTTVSQECQHFCLIGHCPPSIACFTSLNKLCTQCEFSVVVPFKYGWLCKQSWLFVPWDRVPKRNHPARSAAWIYLSTTFSEFLVNHFEILCFGNSYNFLNIVLYWQDAVLNFMPSVIYSCLFEWLQ